MGFSRRMRLFLLAGLVLALTGESYGDSPRGAEQYPPSLAGRSTSAPTAPVTVSRPTSWPGGKAASGMKNGPPSAAAFSGSSPAAFTTPADPYALPPSIFQGEDIVARVGGEVILANDVLPEINQILKERIEAMKAQGAPPPPADQVELFRLQGMEQSLRQAVQAKLVVVEAKRKIPAENMTKIQQNVSDAFEKERIEKLLTFYQVATRAELEAKLREKGTSLTALRQRFFESGLARQFMDQEFKKFDSQEFPHEELVKYYRQHADRYAVVAKVKWEHLMVRLGRKKSREEAYRLIAQMGNDVLRGTPWSEVAKNRSEHSSREQGGMHDWTARGSLASDALDKALFSLPVGQPSPIIEDQAGFHIVRVVERDDRTKRPFGEVQGDIKQQLAKAREEEQRAELLESLRRKTPVWTVFDDFPPEELLARARHGGSGGSTLR